ncbi:MAG: AmmeMemoRadiSam system radical SAM enzyme [Candidatus Woesearchaeota archaeon]|nr:AmmeMemoRadiSam system radical SAM enzyme [Candidatus Woesearchaeota archaeon]
MQEALFYGPYKNALKCTLCPHLCLISEGNLGACAVRKNIDGKLYSLVYGKTITHAVDPIEKKPLFHFYPGSKIFSYATAGCNFKCAFCQNWEISQISKGKEGEIIGKNITPSKIVDLAIKSKCSSIAMTYNEPSIQFEYALDVCKEAKKKNLKTVFVSNGYICKEPIDMLSGYLDAINIDLKSFNDEFYKKICGARLEPVLDAIKHYHSKNIWIEITTLVIPGENDSNDELRRIAEFIASIDKNMPWHISRFHPDYKMTKNKITPIETLTSAYDIGKRAGLHHVYVGNVPGNRRENTYCNLCGKLLIKRANYQVTENNIFDNKCRFCGEKIAGFF